MPAKKNTPETADGSCQVSFAEDVEEDYVDHASAAKDSRDGRAEWKDHGGWNRCGTEEVKAAYYKLGRGRTRKESRG